MESFAISAPGARYAPLCCILALEALVLCAPKSGAVAALSLVVLVYIVWLLHCVLQGRGGQIVIGWILIFPLGYYFLSFPREHSVITSDRVFICLLMMAAAFSSARGNLDIPLLLRRAAICWAMFLVFAGYAILPASSPLTSLRLWIDVFILPAVLAWYVLRHIDVRRCLGMLHVVTCVMTLYVSGIGAAEVFVQRDLLQLPQGGVVIAGDYAADPNDLTAQILIRPNGPFSTVNSFAMVGMVSLFFLFFLKRVIANQMPAWQRILHRLAIAGALAQSLMPLFKSVVVSLLLILLIDAFHQRGRRKVLLIGAVAAAALAFVSLAVVLPDVFAERADPLTFYARLAQEKQTLALFLSHPIFGVGLNNFHQVAEKSSVTYYAAGEALDSPHNNLGAILAETGLTGFLPFCASQVFLFSAFRKLPRTRSSDSQVAWRTFLFVFLAFWINGMALTIVYFQDLNLWYMFVIAALYKFASTNHGVEPSGNFITPALQV